jgi:hypothetical protein
MSEPRYRIYRLCDCETCGGSGRRATAKSTSGRELERHERSGTKCDDCRGEGRVRNRVAECETEQDLGVAIVTLGREGEFADCPIGVLDTAGEVGEKWIVRPWLPSARNVSDAGRTLAGARHTKGERDDA